MFRVPGIIPIRQGRGHKFVHNETILICVTSLDASNYMGDIDI